MRPGKWQDRRATKLNGLAEGEVPEEPWREAYRWAMQLKERQGDSRRMRANDALTLYYGTDAHGTFSGESIDSALGIPRPDVAYNVVQSIVNAKTSHIVRNKVRPMFVTEKGDEELKDKALGMQRAVEATFQQLGIYGEMGRKWCKNGQLFEAGLIKFCPDYANSRVDARLVYAHKFYVDPAEAKAENVRQLAYVDDWDRETLLDFFKNAKPEVLEAIRAAKPVEMLDGDTDGSQIADRIEVVETWHLPSGHVDLEDNKKAFGLNDEGELDASIDPGHDGWHQMCIDGAELIGEPWPFDGFPIAQFKPDPKPGQYWSRSAPERLASIQMQINKWNRRIYEILNLHARPLLVAWSKAKLNRGKVTNDLASILVSQMPPGQALQNISTGTVPIELIARVDKLIEWARMQEGMSELSLSAQRPAGVEHAPPMQYIADTESIRHTAEFRAWEDAHLEAARIVVECLRLLAARKPDLTILFGSSKELQRIKWNDVDLKRDRYHLKTWPANLFSATPQAHIEQLLQMMSTKPPLITPEQALTSLDHPDIESIVGDRQAQRKNVEEYIKRASKSGKLGADTMPNSWLNIPLAVQMTKDRLNLAEANGASDESLDGLRQFYEACVKLQEKMAPPVPPGGPGGPPPPPAGPPGPAGAAAPPNPGLEAA